MAKIMLETLVLSGVPVVTDVVAGLKGIGTQLAMEQAAATRDFGRPAHPILLFHFQDSGVFSLSY